MGVAATVVPKGLGLQNLLSQPIYRKTVFKTFGPETPTPL